jgi:hypothetical protein
MFSDMELLFQFCFSCISTINLAELPGWYNTASLCDILSLNQMQTDPSVWVSNVTALWLLWIRNFDHASMCSIYIYTENASCTSESVDKLKEWQEDATEYGRPILRFPASWEMLAYPAEQLNDSRKQHSSVKRTTSWDLLACPSINKEMC